MVLRWREISDQPLTLDAMRAYLESRGYRVAVYTYPPGTTFPVHSHYVDKMDGVVSGRFRLTMGGDSVVLQAGDMLEVPAGEPHSAEVIGDAPVLSLDGVRI